MTRRALFVVLTGLCGAGALLCQIGNACASAPSGTPSATRISSGARKTGLSPPGAQSRRQIERQADQYVTSVVFQPPGGTLVRWSSPICPLVQGLPHEFNVFFHDRISQIAASAHAPVAGGPCTANLEVFVTYHPDTLLKMFWQHGSRTYDTGNGLGGVERFLHSTRPVRVWYNTAPYCRSPGAAGCSEDDTGLGFEPVDSMSSVYIVVDMNRVGKVTTRQLADYIAMVGLADVRPDPHTGTAPTILELFEPAGRPVPGLSAWDRALLHSLYGTSPAGATHMADLEAAVVSQITRERNPDRAATRLPGPAIPPWADEALPRRGAPASYWEAISAEQGSAAAQYDQGVKYFLGQGVPQDYAKAAQWFREAAEQGHVAAQYNLGVMYLLGHGVPQDYSKADRWFLEAAERGNASAQTALGSAYAEGQGVPRNDIEAAGWFRKAADQGDADAQLDLGSMYAKGRGVPQSYGSAVRWYRAAAEQGNAAAQYDLGVMYALHRSAPRSDARAARWFREAAEKGDVDAQTSLGLAYAKGRGVPRDYVEAARWFRKAAERGDADAQFNLGALYDSGRGVARDPVKAYEWWILAVADSSSSHDAYDWSRNRMKESAARMTPAQIGRARREASEWLAANRPPR